VLALTPSLLELLGEIPGGLSSAASSLLLIAAQTTNHPLLTAVLDLPTVNVNCCDDRRSTPIVIAAARGDRASVRALCVHSRTDVNWQNGKEQSALKEASAPSLRRCLECRWLRLFCTGRNVFPLRCSLWTRTLTERRNPDQRSVLPLSPLCAAALRCNTAATDAIAAPVRFSPRQSVVSLFSKGCSR
jgi:hypothetical protein